MNARTQPVLDLPVGLAEVNGVSHQRLLSSVANGWSDLFVASYRVLPQPEFQAVPEPLHEMHTIYLYLSPGVLNMRCDFYGQVARGRCYPGSLMLGPALVPTAFAWDAAVNNLNVSLTHTLVADTAAAISKTDPVKLELTPRFNFRDSLIESICLALLAELESGGLAGPLYADALGQALALHLLRKYSTGAATRPPHEHKLSAQQIRRVLDYINDQLDRNFTLAELAAAASFSPTYFARQFKQATGLSPHQYLIYRRVERARSLLEIGDLSVAAVAQQVGFADQSHLNRHFKRLVGVAPSAIVRDGKNVHGVGKNVQDENTLGQR